MSKTAFETLISFYKKRLAMQHWTEAVIKRSTSVKKELLGSWNSFTSSLDLHCKYLSPVAAIWWGWKEVSHRSCCFITFSAEK